MGFFDIFKDPTLGLDQKSADPMDSVSSSAPKVDPYVVTPGLQNTQVASPDPSVMQPAQPTMQTSPGVTLPDHNDQNSAPKSPISNLNIYPTPKDNKFNG